MSSNIRIETRDLCKGFATKAGRLEVLDSTDLIVRDGEFVSILGPSGCGKSTLLSVLSGIELPDSGTVKVDGLPPAEAVRRASWMPQLDSLFPWRTVAANVALGFEVAGRIGRAAARRRATRLLEDFGLEQFADMHPHQLSGGMRQRVALARTVAQQRDILLLDEPFGALDALTRTELQLWTEQIWERERWTVLLITHDVREAILLSDRIYVLSSRPASVKLELEVNLERPRSIATLSDPRFSSLEAKLLASLGLGAPETS